MISPYCIIVTGRPGSGKTTLAKTLGTSLRLPVISRDELKEGYVVSTGSLHDALPDDTNWKATDTFFRTTRLLLESGVSTVVEAAFQHKLWAMAIPDWMRFSHTRIILCAPDPDVCAKRHLERGLEDPRRERFHGDTSVRVFRETGEVSGPGEYTPPSFDCPTLKIDTEKDYQPPITQIVDWLKIHEA